MPLIRDGHPDGHVHKKKDRREERER